MPDLDFSSFFRPIAYWIAERAARMREAALASIASIAGNRLPYVQPWFGCGAKRDESEPGSEIAVVVPSLVRALRDPSVEVALRAIDELSRHPGPTAAGALRDVLSNADRYFHPAVRAAAVTALAETLPAADLVLLVEAIGDVDAEVSLATLEALAERAPSLVAPHALHVLRDRSGYYLPLVRRAAAEALLRSRELSPAFARELSESEPDPSIRDLLERAGS